MLRALPLIVLMIFASALAAQAGEPTATELLLEKITPAFQCTAQSEGQLSCQANKQCKCVYKPAEAATGLPDRWAWDCGIMRPRCEVTPADTSDNSYALPPVIIKKDDDEDEGDL